MLTYITYDRLLAKETNVTLIKRNDTYETVNRKEHNRQGVKRAYLLRVGFEPTPFRTRTLIWRLRPTRPSQLDARSIFTRVYVEDRCPKL